MSNTIYNNKAISNIVYLAGFGGSDDGSCGDCCFGVVRTQSDLSLIEAPQEYDVVFIEAGESGGVELAIFHGGAWIIRELKGVKGDKGDKGDSGSSGEKGDKGDKGDAGTNGVAGKTPSHRWVEVSSGGVSTQKLQFQNPNGSWGDIVSLGGADGKNGKDGKNGAKGDKPNHEWSGTDLRFEKPDGSWGVTINLKGSKGNKGDTGDKPNHEWSSEEPTTIRFQNPDGSWGNWQNLKGDIGLVPANQVLDNKIRFQNPDGSWGDYVEYKAESLKSTTPNCITDVADWDSLTDAGKIQKLITKICSMETRISQLEGFDNLFSNSEKSKIFVRNNCGKGDTGGSVRYVVSAGTYLSKISEEDANQQALADILKNGQNYANTRGSCSSNSGVLYEGSHIISLGEGNSDTGNNYPTSEIGGELATYEDITFKLQVTASNMDSEGRTAGDYTAVRAKLVIDGRVIEHSVSSSYENNNNADVTENSNGSITLPSTNGQNVVYSLFFEEVWTEAGSGGIGVARIITVNNLD